MSVEKTIEKLLRGESDANIRFEEITHLLQTRGFRMRTAGSHHIFTRPGVLERINLQREGSKAKPYHCSSTVRTLANGQFSEFARFFMHAVEACSKCSAKF